MGDWFFSIIAVTPMAIVAAIHLDGWLLLAVLAAGFWWARVVEYAAKREARDD